jgi:subtilisin family serine protease
VAKDEWHITTRGRKQSGQSFAALPSAEAVRQRAAALSQSTGDEVELVLYEAGAVHNELTRRILTKQVLVELQSGGDVAGLAAAVGAASQSKVADAPGYFIFVAADTGGALPLAEALRTKFGVVSAEPLLAKRQQKRLAPNDPLFDNQWHLRNTGQNGGTPGVDINITNVWNTYRGTGIGIAIVDDGLQHTHPDLQPNYDPTTSTNLNDQTADPSPDVNFDFHGTACAGVAAARGNNALGVCGAAFQARLAGIRLLGGSFSDADEAVAMRHRNDVLYLNSNSWGPADNGATLAGPGPLMANALVQGVRTGRGGKGTIYVWAGGNGLQNNDNANYDGYVNSIYTIGVGAASDQGNQAFLQRAGGMPDRRRAFGQRSAAGYYHYGPGRRQRIQLQRSARRFV